MDSFMDFLYHYKVVEVLRVVDGDTMDLRIDLGFGLQFGVKDEVRVRLKGIDTPEMRGEEKEAGEAAKQFVVDWFEKYKDHTLVLQTWKDKAGSFGRYLGEIRAVSPDYKEGDIIPSLNNALVDAGHAEIIK